MAFKGYSLIDFPSIVTSLIITLSHTLDSVTGASSGDPSGIGYSLPCRSTPEFAFITLEIASPSGLESGPMFK